MEENSTFKTVTTILGVVIGAILLGIIVVTVYAALNAGREDESTAATTVSESAAAEGDGASEGEGAVEAEAPAEGEAVTDAEAAAEGAATDAVADAVAQEGAAEPAEGAAAGGETAGETGVGPVEVAMAEPVAQAPVHVVDAFNKGGCAGCHVVPGIPGANGQIGPDLSSIGTDGATRIDGYASEDYITESILDPNAFIAPECPNGACPEGVMLQSFADTLTDDDLSTIVDYLAVLGTESAVELAVADEEPVVLDTALPAESVLEPFMALPKDPADPAMIALGKHLFFDQRLSGNNSLSCASCHQPDNAFTDGQAMSRGYPSTMLFRNTPTLFNTAYADYLYRDGRMDGNDLPTTVRDHIAEAHFMSMDGRLMVERINQVPAYVALYDEAFGGEPSYGKTLNAIAAYVRTLNSMPAPYDLHVAGDESALDADAIAGLELFEGKAGCADCHSGDLLTDEGFYNTGVGTDPSLFAEPERHLTFRRFFRILGTPNYRALSEDVGRYALTLNEEDWGAFNTPSLREVERTAPYMHDGSIATLEEVVAFYNEGGGEGQTAGLAPLDLTDEEVGQLVSFLESLSSEPIPVEAPALPGYKVVPLGEHGAAAAASTAAVAEEVTAETDEATADEPAAEEEAVAEEVAAEPAAEEAAEQTAEEEVPAEEAPVEEPAAEDAAEQTAEEEAPAEEAPVEEPAAEEAAEQTAEEEAPAEEAPVEEPAAEEAAAPAPVEVTPELVSAFTKGTCNACHVIPDIPGAVGMVGPDLTGIGVEGATRIDGLSAEEYIRQSLEDPMAFNAPACPFGDCVLGTMPANVRDMINDEEFEMVVEYLASLGSGG